MKVTLFAAMSASGYISRENDREDFLSDENWRQFASLAEKYGAFAVGRRTYDVARKTYPKQKNLDSVNALRIIVSRSWRGEAPNGYVVARSPEAAIMEARRRGLKELLVAGGGSTNSAFMRKGTVNSVVLDIEPFLLGRGIQAFRPERFGKRLRLLGSKRLKGGIMQLRYSVLR